MVGLISRIAGPRVLIGVVLAAALAIAFLLWQWRSAADEAQRLDGALQRTNAELNEALEAKQRSERLVAEAEARADALREKARRRQRQLEEAKADASDEVRDCLRQRLPRDLADGLRVHGDAGTNGDAADTADE